MAPFSIIIYNDGDAVVEINGKTGDVMFGRGAHKFNADGSMSLADGGVTYDSEKGLKVRGGFESNKEGVRFIIDPEDRSLKLINAEGITVGRFSQYSDELGNYYAAISLRDEGGNNGHLSPANLNLEDKDGNSIRLIKGRSKTGLWVGDYQDFEYHNSLTEEQPKHSYFLVDADKKTTRLKMKMKGLPEEAWGLDSGQLWNDGGILRIVE